MDDIHTYVYVTLSLSLILFEFKPHVLPAVGTSAGSTAAVVCRDTPDEVDREVGSG